MQRARKMASSKNIITHESALVNQGELYISADGEMVARQLRKIQRRDFSEADIAAIIAAYQSRVSTTKIAADYGCHPNTISGILKKRGIEVNLRIFKSEEEVRRIISLYEKKHTIEAIAKQFGVGSATINRLLHENGVRVRGRWDY